MICIAVEWINHIWAEPRKNSNLLGGYIVIPLCLAQIPRTAQIAFGIDTRSYKVNYLQTTKMEAHHANVQSSEQVNQVKNYNCKIFPRFKYLASLFLTDYLWDKMRLHWHEQCYSCNISLFLLQLPYFFYSLFVYAIIWIDFINIIIIFCGGVVFTFIPSKSYD